jgi:hypothetical protein
MPSSNQQSLKTKDRQWAANYRYLCADGTYKFVADRGYLISICTSYLGQHTTQPFQLVNGHPCK